MKWSVVLAVCVLAVGAAAVDNVIHEVRFAEAYRHWSSSEHEKSLIVNQGDLVLIRMNENPGTGYRWIIVDEDIPSEICTLQATANGNDGLYEASTSKDGSDDKVVDGVPVEYVPPGAGEWPYPYPWGDRRFDLRCKGSGTVTVKLRYKRSWEDRYSWESRLMLDVLPA